MVGPISDDERRAGARWIALTFVLVITVSTGMIAVQTEASLVQTVAVMAVGTIVGIGLFWYLIRITNVG